jgi:hypothetical protein
MELAPPPSLVPGPARAPSEQEMRVFPPGGASGAAVKPWKSGRRGHSPLHIMYVARRVRSNDVCHKKPFDSSPSGLAKCRVLHTAQVPTDQGKVASGRRHHLFQRGERTSELIHGLLSSVNQACINIQLIRWRRRNRVGVCGVGSHSLGASEEYEGRASEHLGLPGQIVKRLARPTSQYQDRLFRKA